MSRQDTATQVAAADLTRLPEREQQILTAYYLNHATLDQTGKPHGLNKAQTRQVRDEALAALGINT